MRIFTTTESMKGENKARNLWQTSISNIKWTYICICGRDETRAGADEGLLSMGVEMLVEAEIHKFLNSAEFMCLAGAQSSVKGSEFVVNYWK